MKHILMKFPIQNVFKNKPFLGALLGTFLIYFLEEYFFEYRISIMIGIASNFFTQNGKVLFYLSSLISLFIYFSFIWLTLSSEPKIQFLYITLFVVAEAIQYGFWKAVQRFLSVIELNLATATPIDIWAGAARLYFDWRLVFPVLVFLWILRFFYQ
jgi:hypothetical protein